MLVRLFAAEYIHDSSALLINIISVIICYDDKGSNILCKQSPEIEGEGDLLS